MEKLNANEVKKMFLFVSSKMIESKPYLTELDSAIGDGDHGIGMSIGFTEAHKNLKSKDFSTINDVFQTIGMSLLSTMGGASGVIFGTLFTGGVRHLEPKEHLNLETLSFILDEALFAIKTRGKAKAGDKTMIDALEPAVQGLKHSVKSKEGLLEGLRRAESLAKQGVENTKQLVATFGRAKSLGERAIGHQDAGATSVSIIFQSMREWLEANYG